MRHKFENGDYCLWCKDIQMTMPTEFIPCIVKGYNKQLGAVIVKELKSGDSVTIAPENLIFVKELPKYEMELMYNSRSKKGGSYNVTSQDGTQLKASFYFDNEDEKVMAERAASIFNDSYGIF